VHRLILLRCLLTAAISMAICDGAAGSDASPPSPRLFRTTLRIEPTAQQVATLPRPEAQWHIAAPLAARFTSVLAAAQFSEPVTNTLRERLTIDPLTREGTIVPDAALLDLFQDSERARWWAVLSTYAGNRSYRWPPTVPTSVLDELGRDPDFSEAVRRIRRWGLHDRARVFFADLFVLDGAFASSESRQAFFQRFFGTETAFAKLVTDTADPETVNARAAYWQAHGRSRMLEPILSAIGRIEDHDRVDLAHLLPRSVRSLLYTFPSNWQTIGEPSFENAAVAASFFAPDLDPAQVLARGFSVWLEEHCTPVSDPWRYGDIVVYQDPASTRWPFAMIHIADGIVFGRRPTLYGAWELQPEDEIVRLNPNLRGAQVRAYRPRFANVTADKSIGEPQRWLPPAWPEKSMLESLPAGPWGRLKFYDVLLAPSSEVLERMAVPDRRPVWRFHGVRPEAFQEAIGALDAPKTTRNALRSLFDGVRPDRRGFITVHPAPELVLATPPEFRTRFFPQLQHGVQGSDYAQEIGIPTQAGAHRWFSPELLPDHARDTLVKLTYPRGPGLMLSDFGTLYHTLSDPSERLAALRALYRTPALIVLLERPTADEIPGLAAYWRTGSQKSTERLLQSFASNKEMLYLDIVHLMPPLAREFMNVYLRSPAHAPVPNCYWTSLNFTAVEPDPRLLVTPGAPGEEERVAWELLERDYTPAKEASLLGDLIVYRGRARGDLRHVCVHIAAGLVFTKNGFGSFRPWCLMHLADVDALYAEDPAVERLVYRPRGVE